MTQNQSTVDPAIVEMLSGIATADLRTQRDHYAVMRHHAERNERPTVVADCAAMVDLIERELARRAALA